MDIRERKHRLSSTLYHGRAVVSFTACLSDKVPIFNKTEIFNPISQILLNSLNQWICDAHVYLFMPDHCHLLIEGKATDSDLIRFMKDFKQKSGYWLSKNAAGIKWQKDF